VSTAIGCSAPQTPDYVVHLGDIGGARFDALRGAPSGSSGGGFVWGDKDSDRMD